MFNFNTPMGFMEDLPFFGNDDEILDPRPAGEYFVFDAPRRNIVYYPDGPSLYAGLDGRPLNHLLDEVFPSEPD